MTDYMIFIFATLGLIFSLFYGINATKIFDVSCADKLFAWRAHQFWLNFIGSAAGWTFSYLLATDITQNIMTHSNFQITVGQILTFVVSFIGITGYMPATIVGLVVGVKEIFEKAAGLLK